MSLTLPKDFAKISRPTTSVANNKEIIKDLIVFSILVGFLFFMFVTMFAAPSHNELNDIAVKIKEVRV